MDNIIYITFYMKTRGSISYYSSALLASLHKNHDTLSVVEIKHQNSWGRALAELWSVINVNRHQPGLLAQTLSWLALPVSEISEEQALQPEAVSAYYSADSVVRIMLKRLEKS